MRFKYTDYKDLRKINTDVRKDVVRIRNALWDRGMNTYLIDAYYMWREYSESLCAGWITLPESDEKIFNILVEQEEN